MTPSPHCATSVYALFQASAQAYGERPALTYLSNLEPRQTLTVSYNELLSNINRDSNEWLRAE